MTSQDRGTPRHRSPTTASRHVPDRNQGNNSHRQATDGGEPRTIRQAPRATANTGNERKELQQRGQEKSRSLDNQTVGTAKRKQQGQGKESYPLKKGGTKTGPQPSYPARTNAKGRNPGENNSRRGVTRGQGGRMPHQRPHKHPIQEQQEGPKDCDPTTWPARAGEGQAEKSEGGRTTKGSHYCTNLAANMRRRQRRLDSP